MDRTLLTLDQLQQQLDDLNNLSTDEWSIVRDRLHKTFVFKNFVDAFGFMTRAAFEAEKMDHHPDWSNVYKTVVVNLNTHDAGGITALDFVLAEKMEKLL